MPPHNLKRFAGLSVAIARSDDLLAAHGRSGGWVTRQVQIDAGRFGLVGRHASFAMHPCVPREASTGSSSPMDALRMCLLLVTTDRNAFFSLSEAKKKIVERLGKN